MKRKTQQSLLSAWDKFKRNRDNTNKVKMFSFENIIATRRQKAIPWDAWARECSIGMNCEVKLVPES